MPSNPSGNRSVRKRIVAKIIKNPVKGIKTAAKFARYTWRGGATARNIRPVLEKKGFKFMPRSKFPTINFFYSAEKGGKVVEWGDSEIFRLGNWHSGERGNPMVKPTKSDLLRIRSNQGLFFSNKEAALKEIDSIVPRIGIGELLSGSKNSIFGNYRPMVVVMRPNEIFVVKFAVDGSSHWYELTPQESNNISSKLGILEKKK